MKVLMLANTTEELFEPGDTSARLLRESFELGLHCFVAERAGVTWRHGTPCAIVKSIGDDGAFMSDSATVPITDFHLVHLRFDPPVERSFLECARVLSVCEGTVVFVNPPTVIATLCEKLIPFPELMPRTIVTRSLSEARAFGEHVGKSVLKPLNDACSRRVELLDWSTGALRDSERRFNEISSTGEYVLLQEFMPQICEGETRCWLLDGEPVGWMRKRIRRSDFRFSLDDGDHVEAWTPQAMESRSIERVGKWLKRRGVRLAAVDLIGDLITDVNVTSPGLLVELERVSGRNITGDIIRALMCDGGRQ